MISTPIEVQYTKISSEHIELVANVKRCIDIFMKHFIIETNAKSKKECKWFIAGGFASYVCGRTLSYNDIDVYIITETLTNYVSHSLNILLGEHVFDFILVPKRFRYMNMLNILAGFDFDICRVAIPRYGNMIVSISEGPFNFGDVKSELNNNRRSNNRAIKYLCRLNRKFKTNKNNTICKTLNRSIIPYECGFFEYNNEREICNVFDNLCKHVTKNALDEL